jgi:hypothetical protein
MSGKPTEAAVKQAAHGLAAKDKSTPADLHELKSAYEEISVKNVRKLTAAISALSDVKDPAEFIKLQQKVMTEAMSEAVADSAHIFKLSAAAFTAAFKPV